MHSISFVVILCVNDWNHVGILGWIKTTNKACEMCPGSRIDVTHLGVALNTNGRKNS